MTIDQYTDTLWQLAAAGLATVCVIMLLYGIIWFVFWATRTLMEFAHDR